MAVFWGVKLGEKRACFWGEFVRCFVRVMMGVREEFYKAVLGALLS